MHHTQITYWFIPYVKFIVLFSQNQYYQVSN